MDDKTKQQIRESLLTRWNRIGSLRLVDAHRPAEAEGQAEIIDIAQSLEQLGRDTSLAEQERRELMAIERALAKIASANFGVCEDCGEEIPSKRMLVVPEARLCAGCQAVEERQAARVRAPGLVAR